MTHHYPECIPALRRAGISEDDAYALRRIAMTLHRWHELECGDGNDYASWCIVRGAVYRPRLHWHKFNPWADRAVYVPIDKLAEALAGGTVNDAGNNIAMSAEWLLNHWRECAEKVDSYILPTSSGQHSIGIRYGREPGQYMSPFNSNPEKVDALLREYEGTRPFVYADNGAPYIERHIHVESKPRYERVPDRETGALKRLASIMANYPTLKAYVQGDPRGAALYVLRPGDVPEGADADAYYSRGLAIYK